LEKRVPARLTRKEGRSFGLVVGGAFLVIAGITIWRGHEAVAWVTGALGTTLALAGLVIPTHLGPVQRGWMRLAHLISKVTTPIVMSILYFVVITPAGLLMRLLGRNPLRHPLAGEGFWVTRSAESRTDMRRQF
jgi:hypothetical protein